eukprot:7376854-Prymnesium_polylepis.3
MLSRTASRATELVRPPSAFDARVEGDTRTADGCGARWVAEGSKLESAREDGRVRVAVRQDAVQGDHREIRRQKREYDVPRPAQGWTPPLEEALDPMIREGGKRN